MSQENVENVRRGYEAFARGDLDAVLERLDSAVDWHPVIAPILDVETVRGKEAVRRFFHPRPVRAVRPIPRRTALLRGPRRLCPGDGPLHRSWREQRNRDGPGIRHSLRAARWQDRDDAGLPDESGCPRSRPAAEVDRVPL